MNWQALEGNWQQLRDDMSSRWDRLEPADLERADGSAERLIAILRERYGWSRSKAESELRAYVDSIETYSTIKM